MALLSLAMPMLLGAVWLAFGSQFEARRSDALLLWSPISVAASWAVAPEALPRTQRASGGAAGGVLRRADSAAAGGASHALIDPGGCGFAGG